MGNCLPKRKRRNKVGVAPTVTVKEREREKQVSEILIGSYSSINTVMSEEELTMVQAFGASDEEWPSVHSLMTQPIETALDEVKAEAAAAVVKKPVCFQIDYVQGMRSMPSRLAERLESKPRALNLHSQVVFIDEDEDLMDAILAESEANERRRALEEKQKAAKLLREEKLKAIREKSVAVQSRPPSRVGLEGAGEG